MDERWKCGKLECGTSYYVRSNKKPENRCELRLIVSAGSVLEEEQQRGVAHIVEHLAFRATEKYHHVTPPFCSLSAASGGSGTTISH